MPKKQKRTNLKLSILAAAVMATPLVVQAAGLGKLTVLSALGQPLRAELDVTAGADELNSLHARVAPPEAFRQANIEYATALSGLRFTLEKRPGGQPYFRISSDRPIGDPFLDFLVELNWSAGRLVREYTFLLDPPELKAGPQEAAAPVVVPEVSRDEPSKGQSASVESPVPSPAALPKPTPRRELRQVRPGATEERLVKRGDTLGRIAAESKPEGVSLDQMLVALFRGNPEAFDGGNMNRLKAGKILSLPSADVVAAMPAAEARSIVTAQSADFDVYRKRLAASAAAAPAMQETVPQQAAAGKIAPRVEDKAPLSPGKDKLQVSRTDSKDGWAAGKAAGSEEAAVVREKALRDAQSRITELEKNLDNLKKLAEMKSQAAASAQQQAQASKPAQPGVASKSVEAAAPTKAQELPKPVAEPVKAADTAETKQPAIAPQAAKPTVKKAPPPPPPPAPSFFEENQPLVLGGGGLIALLAGYFGFRTWQRKRAVKESPASVADGSLYASSVFSASGGSSIDTSAAGAVTDFGLGAIEGVDAHDAVDPIQEADVYLAYGRDTQAEEILLDALKQDPTRLAVHLKLLEVYASRMAIPQFNTVASDLHSQTGGEGEEWAKAAALGRVLDPSNSLYGESVPASSPENTGASAAATVIMAASSVAAEPSSPELDTLQQEELPESLDFDLDLSGAALEPAVSAEEVKPAAAEENVVLPVEEVASLDFDLDLGTPEAESAPTLSVDEVATGVGDEIESLDFDLGGLADSAAEPSPTPVASVAVGPDANMLDFDFDLGTPQVDAAPPAPAIEESPAIDLPVAEPMDDQSIDFDLDITLDAATPDEPQVSSPMAAPVVAVVAASEPEPSIDFDFDLSLDEPEHGADAAPLAPLPGLAEISLDLDVPGALSLEEPSPPLPDLASDGASQEDDPEVATKLELAQAYEEMGDKEGARELFQEVLNEGSLAQQAIARDKLAQLV